MKAGQRPGLFVCSRRLRDRHGYPGSHWRGDRPGDWVIARTRKRANPSLWTRRRRLVVGKAETAIQDRAGEEIGQADG